MPPAGRAAPGSPPAPGAGCRRPRTVPRRAPASRLRGRDWRRPGRHRAGGDSVHVRRAAGLLDQGLEVLDLTLDRERSGVATVAAAAAIVGEYREVLPQQFGQGPVGPGRPVAERPVNQDERRSLATRLTGRSAPGRPGPTGPWP